VQKIPTDSKLFLSIPQGNLHWRRYLIFGTIIRYIIEKKNNIKNYKTDWSGIGILSKYFIFLLPKESPVPEFGI